MTVRKSVFILFILCYNLCYLMIYIISKLAKDQFYLVKLHLIVVIYFHMIYCGNVNITYMVNIVLRFAELVVYVHNLLCCIKFKYQIKLLTAFCWWTTFCEVFRSCSSYFLWYSYTQSKTTHKAALSFIKILIESSKTTHPWSINFFVSVDISFW